METKEILKVIGGAAIQKIQDRYLPSYTIAGIDLVRVGVGVAEIAAAIFGEKQFGLIKDVTETLGVAGGVQLVNEVAKLAIPAGPVAVSVPTAVPVVRPTVSFY